MCHRVAFLTDTFTLQTARSCPATIIRSGSKLEIDQVNVATTLDRTLLESEFEPAAVKPLSPKILDMNVDICPYCIVLNFHLSLSLLVYVASSDSIYRFTVVND
jgi:hypothetical protein